jgi:putative ABC transport system permease protein
MFRLIQPFTRRQPILGSVWADVKLTAYQLRKLPVFTVTVIATLALGIGANTAIFSVIDAVLLKPLSYPDPGRIVQFLLKPSQGKAVPSSSIADFRLWRDQTRAFQDVSAYDFAPVGLSLTGDAPEELRTVHVTADYFRLFGASTFLGGHSLQKRPARMAEMSWSLAIVSGQAS